MAITKKVLGAMAVVAFGVISIWIAFEMGIGEPEPIDETILAKEFCLDRGHALEEKSGDVYVCRFENDYICEIHEYYRGNCIDPSEKEVINEEINTSVNDTNGTENETI